MIKILIASLFKNKEATNIWGFKEIRYDNGAIKYLKEFKELFPQTKVIIQVRGNIAAQSQSSWLKKDKNAIQYLNALNNEFYNFYNQNKEWCYFTTFEKMFDMENIKKIFEFIDCSQYYDQSKIKQILDNNIKD
jgi:hypothetical protein